MSLATKEFQRAVQPTKFPDTSNTFFHNVVHSQWAWGGITGAIVFLYLYCLNPPLVQYKKTSDGLVKPGVNVSLVIMYSLLAASIVMFGPMISKLFQKAK